MKLTNKQIVVNETLVRYTDTLGSKPILVLLHGWLDSADTFANLENDLSAKFRCIALDLPAFGASEVSDDVTTIEQYAEFVASFLQKIEVSDYALLGHSMGGQIVIYGVATGVLRPRRLVLVAAAGVRNRQKVKKTLLKMAARPLRRLAPSRVKRALYRRLGSDYSPELKAHHKKIIAAVLGRDIQAEAAQIAIPTLLIYGDRDEHTPLEFGQTLKRAIKGSSLQVIPGANHWVHQTNAQQVARAVEDFAK